MTTSRGPGHRARRAREPGSTELLIVKTAPVLAALVGTLLACIVAVTAVLLFSPFHAELLGWVLGLRRQPVACVTLYPDQSPEEPCAPVSGGMLITTDYWSDPHDEPLVEMELGSQRRTLFARFSRSWAEKRSVFFVIQERAIEVDVRFDTDYGSYAGAVDGDLSRAHVHPDELCFDLSLERLDGSGSVERWQGRLSLQ
jgi:hypothetical protein